MPRESRGHIPGFVSAFCSAVVIALSGCGGGGGDAPTPSANQQPAKFQIGGTVSGSHGTVVLQLNSAESINAPGDGAFTFATQVSSGAAYSVAVTSSPTGQKCSIEGGSGIATGTVGNVHVLCSDVSQTSSVLTGTITGLSGTLVLAVSGAQFVFSSDGPFSVALPQQVSAGAAYEVTVASKPWDQYCRVTAGTGTLGTPPTNVLVTCQHTYAIGVSYSGLQGDMTLSNNATDTQTVSTGGGIGSGTIYFPSRQLSGDTYLIAIDSQPAQQLCTVSGGNGVIADGDVLVSVVCDARKYSIGGVVSNLHSTLVLRNNGTDDLSLTTDGAFAFHRLLTAGSSYDVTIAAQPQGQQCALANGSGTANRNVVSISVTCTAPAPHTLGGRLIGARSAVVLRNNAGNALTVGSDGSFTFTSPVFAGTSYSVTASSADANQKCMVFSGSGVMPDADFTEVNVVCNNKRATRFAYVVNASDGQGGHGYISQYSVETDGSLSPLTPTTVTAGSRPFSLTLDPTGRFAYAGSDPALASISGTRLWQFTIGSSGTLAPMSVASVDTGGPIGPPSMNPSGTYLYASRDGDVLRFAIGADGALQAPQVQTLVSSGSLGGSIAFDHAGEHAYVIGADSTGNSMIYQFRVESDGALSSLSPAAIEALQPPLQSLLCDPFDRSVYAIDAAFSRIMQLRRTMNGALTQHTPASVYGATVFPYSVIVEPFGSSAYVSAPGSIAQFTVGSNGALSADEVSSVRSSDETFGTTALDFAGAYLYAISSLYSDGSKWLRQFNVNADGSLTQVSSGSLPAGMDPVQIVLAR